MSKVSGNIFTCSTWLLPIVATTIENMKNLPTTFPQNPYHASCFRKPRASTNINFELHFLIGLFYNSRYSEVSTETFWGENRNFEPQSFDSAQKVDCLGPRKYTFRQKCRASQKLLTGLTNEDTPMLRHPVAGRASSLYETWL